MDFCVSIATQLILDQVKNGSSENMLMSPMSINMTLNMVASGIGGKTLEQFKEFLGSEGINDFNDKSSIMMSLLASETAAASSSDETETTKPIPTVMFDGAPQNPMPWESPYSSLRELRRKKRQRRPPLFSLAKALWVDNGFPLIPSFKEITESIYKAQVKNVDFRTRAEQVKKDVNSWVENETKGLIQGLLSPDVELKPPLCLANALYFKGAWEHTFDISMNLDENFYLLNGETIKVSFMTFAYECRSYASFDNYKVLKLPYQSGPQCTNKQFSMYFFLPHRRFGLQDMMEKFNSDRTILEPKHLHLDEVRLSKVWIPKLKFSYSVDAIQLIEDKGLTRPFDPMEADFTNMSNGSNVFISRILHKSHIEVNAEGTEAAAVTFVEESDLFGSALDWSPPPPLPSFVADHPFMFMVVEEFSKLVIFSGAVLNPNE